MSNFGVSNRYAKAFLEIVEKSGRTKEISSDMNLIYETFSVSKELRKLLASPVIKESKKKEIIDDLFAGKVSKDSVNFLRFIIDKNRDAVIFDIVKRFNEIWDDKNGIINAEVVTSVEVDDDVKNEMVERLEKYSGKKIRPKYKTNDDIIGGYVVRIKDTVIDSSIKNKLELLKKKFQQQDFITN